MSTKIEFDLSDLPEVVHAAVQARLNKVVEDCQKYADCAVNRRAHLIHVVLPRVTQELFHALTKDDVLDDTATWLNANGKSETIYARYMRDNVTKFTPAWDGPSRRLTNAIVDHYRPETL